MAVIARGVTLMVLLVAPAAMLAPAPSQVTGDAEASHRRYKPYCKKGTRKPPGCIRVPNAARRRQVDPQARPTVKVGVGVNAGGVGGDADTRAEAALEWASGFHESRAWAYRSQRFVEVAYAVEKPYYDSPQDALRGLRSRLHRGSSTLAPRGALMLFEGDRINRRIGHIGLSLGDGRMLSALDVVGTTDVAGSRYWRYVYVGWVRAPSTWRGRLPLPPGLEPAGFNETSVEFQAPAIDKPVSGVVRVQVFAPHGPVAFSAYYSKDPAGGIAPDWHEVGGATDLGGGIHAFDWDTRGVPDQGNADSGIVTLAAFVVDGANVPQGVGAYRRVSVRNAAP